MPCFHPVPAAQDAQGDRVRFNVRPGEETVTLPCGSCVGCQSSYATMWAHRCMHEASTWPHNSFLTLTYDNEHIPGNGFLVPSHLTRFFKRLRQRVVRGSEAVRSDGSGRVRYFACGEYGEESGRPHYHALLFNLDFSDTRQVAAQGHESELLNELWPYGMHQLGSCTIQSAQYIARYALKKQGKWEARPFDRETGEVRPDPYLRMSMRPGIGATWLEKYAGDLRKGYVTVDGERQRVPRAYVERLKRSKDPHDRSLAEEISFNSYKQSTQYGVSDRSDPDRLRAGEVLHLQRKYDSESRRKL